MGGLVEQRDRIGSWSDLRTRATVVENDQPVRLNIVEAAVRWLNLLAGERGIGLRIGQDNNRHPSLRNLHVKPFRFEVCEIVLRKALAEPHRLGLELLRGVADAQVMRSGRGSFERVEA